MYDTVFLRFQTEEFSMWNIQRNAKSEKKSGSIMEMKNRFRSAEIGKTGIVYMHLYPNRWGLVNHN